MNSFKKVLLGIGFVGIVAGCTVGICLTMNPQKVESASSEENSLAAHYNVTDVEFCEEAQLNFNTDTQTFRYYPSVVSSAVLQGTYELTKNQLVLTTEGDAESLVFQVVEDGLEFDKTESSYNLDIPDKTVFMETKIE